jgi:DNA-directed RNA polymerase subunit RPC12/RpoP
VAHDCGSIFSINAAVLETYQKGKGVIRCPYCFKIIPSDEIKQFIKESV